MASLVNSLFVERQVAVDHGERINIRFLGYGTGVRWINRNGHPGYQAPCNSRRRITCREEPPLRRDLFLQWKGSKLSFDISTPVATGLTRADDGGRFPTTVKQFGLRQVVTHGEHKRRVRRRNPIGFLFFARRIGLDVESESPVGVALELREHWRVDEVTINGIFHQKLLRQIVHGQGPEGVYRWEVARRKAQSVARFASIERLP